MRKILNLAPERSLSTHYFRFALRGAIATSRSPLLEKLIARADTFAAVTDWRTDAFRLIAPPTVPMPGMAATAWYAEFGATQAATVLFATPVHYVAELSNVRLPADGILSLHAAQMRALAMDFNRVWADSGFRLTPGARARLFCVSDRPMRATTRDPEEVLDRHIEAYLPTGPAASVLRLLMSEIEMWLFQHAVNQSRRSAAAPSATGLWLWGGGPAVTSRPPVRGWTAGDDPFFNALTAARAPAEADGAAPGVLASTARPGTPAWLDVETQLERSWASLRAGRIGCLALSAKDRCFSVGARAALRFWRRPRPWWEYFP
jgi:hypothetical protein